MSRKHFSDPNGDWTLVISCTGLVGLEDLRPDPDGFLQAKVLSSSESSSAILLTMQRAGYRVCGVRIVDGPEDQPQICLNFDGSLQDVYDAAIRGSSNLSRAIARASTSLAISEMGDFDYALIKGELAGSAINVLDLDEELCLISSEEG